MSIKITLDNQLPIYPGNNIKGNVSCAFSSSTDIRSIKIRFNGKEYTEWNTGAKNNPRHWGEKFFFKLETILFESDNARIEPGHYNYPFSFVLPLNSPSPFKYEYGYIRYTLKAFIDISFAPDPEDHMDLPVISILDINTLPDNLRQMSESSGETLMGCCWCYNTEPIKMVARINKLVFITGETIKIKMEIQNMSNSNVDDITVRLVRTMVAQTMQPYHAERTEEDILLTMKHLGLGAHAEKVESMSSVEKLILIINSMKS